jgi:hypothetical protein
MASDLLEERGNQREMNITSLEVGSEEGVAIDNA